MQVFVVGRMVLTVLVERIQQNETTEDGYFICLVYCYEGIANKKNYSTGSLSNEKNAMFCV